MRNNRLSFWLDPLLEHPIFNVWLIKLCLSVNIRKPLVTFSFMFLFMFEHVSYWLRHALATYKNEAWAVKIRRGHKLNHTEPTWMIIPGPKLGGRSPPKPPHFVRNENMNKNVAKGFRINRFLFPFPFPFSSSSCLVFVVFNNDSQW